MQHEYNTHFIPSRGRTVPHINTLQLSQTKDEVDANYTCEVSNFLGVAKYNYRVQLPTEKQLRENNLVLTITGISLVVAILILLFVLVFYQLVSN